MKLLFDLKATQPTSSTKRHGGGKYGEIIFKRIVERNLPVSVYYDFSNWLNPEIKGLITAHKIEAINAKENLNDVLKKEDFSCIYSPIINDEILNTFGCKLKTTMHGIRALELSYDPMIWKYNSVSFKEKVKFLIKKIFPKFGYKHAFKIYLAPLKKKNMSFVMVSQHSVHSLLAYCPQYKGRGIKFFYSPSTSKDQILSSKYEDKYFLLVSGNRWEKNNLRTIIALDRLFENGFLDGYKVRITGAPSAAAYKYKIKNLDQFQFMGYVEDDELEQLYHDAYALIYMSLNEGFGYPPLEAMHYGIPCILSPFTSISEICAEAGLYANPYSIEEIMSRILEITEESFYKEYASLSAKRFKLVTEKQKDDLDRLINYIYKE